MNKKEYKLNDNIYDIVLTNKENILALLNAKSKTTLKEYKTENEFLNTAEIGDIGFIEQNAGQYNLLIKGTNGLISQIINKEETVKLLADLETKLKTYVDSVKNIDVYHFGTIDDANASTIPFKENSIAWIGTTGDWIGYHFTGGKWVANGTTSSHTATVDTYTKAEADSLFAPKEYDFSNIDSNFVFSENSGNRFQMITKPANEDAPIGTEIKLKPVINATDPNQIPQDIDQITYGIDLLWINKANGDIMSWSEIKDSVSQDKLMIIIRLDDTTDQNGNVSKHYQLVGWELPPATSNDVLMDDSTIIDLENIGIDTR